MTAAALIALLPLIILAAGTVVTMLVIAFYRRHVASLALTLATFVLAFISVLYAAAQGNQQVTPLLIFDSYAYFITGLLLAASFVVALLAYGYLRIHAEKPDEFYLLLLSATLGASVLAASSHFVSFFLGLEILSISLYAMIGYSYQQIISIEAATKYLILAASSAAFLLFGMALIYAELGTMQFAQIAADLTARAAGATSIYTVIGLVLMLVGIGFKLALVPFHMWTPDVYEGAPAPATSFVASVSKGSMFAILIRFFNPLNISGNPPMLVVFVVIAVATMLIGTLLALQQANLKRLLAYSSVTNLGYLLVAFVAGGASAITASTFYLVSYFVTILAAFGVVTVLSSRARDTGDLPIDYRGLMWRHPWLAVILAVSMFSLAGIPLTVGFVGKFYLVFAGVKAALWLLVIVLVVSSAIGLYYYLRVVTRLFEPSAEPSTEAQPAPSFTGLAGVALAALLVLLIWLGVYPFPFIQAIQALTTATH